jgi:hypothetical protein
MLFIKPYQHNLLSGMYKFIKDEFQTKKPTKVGF